MPIDATTITMAVIALLMIVWFVGLVRKVGGCLIHLLLLGAGGLLIYALYTGQIALPL